MKLKFILIMVLIMQTTWAESTIHLKTTQYSKLKPCQNLDKLHIVDNLIEFEKIKTFSISHEDKLTISLMSKFRNRCYFFDYVPEQSPFMHLSIQATQLTILEMYGSRLNGNWLKRTFNIDLHNLKLHQISAQHISFSTDDDGHTVENISDWDEQ